ncbi:MAG TPA: OB-fold nucleic acid binding domain-containing protein [Anaeromyxobacteraceae bacterium]|nr:OB-fold nucleic acid binding domain-containing protein [Anaeromyxobacteraceae bacterium]
MLRLLTVAALILAVTACKRESPRPPAAMVAPAPAAPPAAAPSALHGKILEKIDVSQYSYLKLATASGDTWAAVEKNDRKLGDEVSVSNPFPMQNFESKELGRKFDLVYFGSLSSGETPPSAPAMPASGGAAPASPATMAAQHQAAAGGPADVKVEKVAKASGSDARTVAEIWAQRLALKGKSVTVRGQVVKSTAVMGRNFIHLRDGSGSVDKKDNDVTVTTKDPAAVGDIVTAQGQIITDKDFGAGYSYPVLIEDAKLSK